jgi:hypothetical protein
MATPAIPRGVVCEPSAPDEIVGLAAKLNGITDVDFSCPEVKLVASDDDELAKKLGAPTPLAPKVFKLQFVVADGREHTL